MTSDSITFYTRGTKTVRVKTARLIPGDVLLTVPARDHLNSDGAIVRLTGVAQTKTGSVLRTVAELGVVFQARHGRRQQRTYTVVFTDGTISQGNAPSQTWDAIASGRLAPPSGSGSDDWAGVQHEARVEARLAREA